MKKSTNMSTKRIMSTREPKYIRPSTWANTGATDEIQAREYWLPKLTSAGSSPVARSINLLEEPSLRDGSSRI